MGTWPGNPPTTGVLPHDSQGYDRSPPQPEPNWRVMFAEEQQDKQYWKRRCYANEEFINRVYDGSHDDGLDYDIRAHQDRIKREFPR